MGLNDSLVKLCKEYKLSENVIMSLFYLGLYRDKKDTLKNRVDEYLNALDTLLIYMLDYTQYRFLGKPSRMQNNLDGSFSPTECKCYSLFYSQNEIPENKKVKNLDGIFICCSDQVIVSFGSLNEEYGEEKVSLNEYCKRNNCTFKKFLEKNKVKNVFKTSMDKILDKINEKMSEKGYDEKINNIYNELKVLMRRRNYKYEFFGEEKEMGDCEVNENKFNPYNTSSNNPNNYYS